MKIKTALHCLVMSRPLVKVNNSLTISELEKKNLLSVQTFAGCQEQVHASFALVVFLHA